MIAYLGSATAVLAGVLAITWAVRQDRTRGEDRTWQDV